MLSDFESQPIEQPPSQETLDYISALEIIYQATISELGAQAVKEAQRITYNNVPSVGIMRPAGPKKVLNHIKPMLGQI